MLVLYNTAIQAIERDKKKQVTKKEFCFLSVGDKFSHLFVFIALGRKFDPSTNVAVQYVEIPETSGKYVIALYFDPTELCHAPYTYDGRAYYKVENTTVLMPRQMFEYHLRINNPSKFSWEREVNGQISAEDMDEDRILSIIQSGINKGRIPVTALKLTDVMSQLNHFRITDSKGGIMNSAMVLFGREPYRMSSQCKVRLARFEGTSMKEFRD